MSQFERPDNRDYYSLSAYFWNRRPLDKNEEQVYWRKADLVALKPQREPNWLEAILDRLLGRFDNPVFRVSKS